MATIVAVVLMGVTVNKFTYVRCLQSYVLTQRNVSLQDSPPLPACRQQALYFLCVAQGVHASPYRPISADPRLHCLCMGLVYSYR